MWGRVISAAGPDAVAIDAADSEGRITEEARLFARSLAVDSGTIVIVRPDYYFGPVSSNIDGILSWFTTLKYLESCTAGI
tara:strand:+ start:145 stop:384 length:240 start_codon:yes stop_codon:yes gene_type:complete